MVWWWGAGVRRVRSGWKEGEVYLVTYETFLCESDQVRASGLCYTCSHVACCYTCSHVALHAKPPAEG
jgi:hypothetical protein